MRAPSIASTSAFSTPVRRWSCCLIAAALLAGLTLPARAEPPDDEPPMPSEEQLPPPSPAPLPAPAAPAAPSPLPAAPPPAAPAPAALPSNPLLAPPPSPLEVQLRSSIQRRNNGIALVVTGTLLQFIGVSFLVPAVLHSGEYDTFPGVTYGAVGGSLVGLGNIVEGVGWSFIIRSSRERDRMRRSGIQFAPVSAISAR